MRTWRTAQWELYMRNQMITVSGEWDEITNVKSDYRIPWISVRVLPVISPTISRILWIFFSLYEKVSLSHERKLSKPRTIKARGWQQSRLSLFFSLCLFRINYALMRSNVSSDRKGPSRMARWRVTIARGISRGIFVKFQGARVAKSAVSRSVSRISTCCLKLWFDSYQVFRNADAIVYSMILRVLLHTYDMFYGAIGEKDTKKRPSSCLFRPGRVFWDSREN